MFKFMLNDTVKWSSLTISSDYNKKNTYHYKYLNAVYKKWSKNNIFKKEYIEMLEYFKLKHIKKSDAFILLILALCLICMILTVKQRQSIKKRNLQN